MAREANVALQAKILQIGFVCMFLFGTMYAIRLLAYGSRFTFAIIVMLLLGAGIVFLLDERFWMILPATALMTIRIDRLHGSIAFFCAAACFSVFLIRIPFRRDTLKKLPRCVLFSLPFFLWTVGVCAMNPPGLLVAGGSHIGARFYIQLFLGFLLLFSFSRLSASEMDCKLLYQMILWGILASVFHVAWCHFFPSLGDQFDVESDATRYYRSSVLPILVLLLSRHKVLSFFTSPSRFIAASVVFLFVLFSGKRAIFAKLLILPFVICFLKKRDRLVMIFMAAIAGVMIGVLCMGQGTLFNLPRSAQRVLSVFPGKWDSQFDRYGLNDDFRHELRTIGLDVIRRAPVFGRKGYALDLESLSWVSARGTMYEGHVFAGNWHNAWLSFAADFGIPGFLFAVLFIVAILKAIVRRLSQVPSETWQQACALYFAVSIILQLAVSYVSGTSCTLFYYCALHFAMFLLVTNSVHRDIGGVDFAAQFPNPPVKE